MPGFFFVMRPLWPNGGNGGMLHHRHRPAGHMLLLEGARSQQTAETFDLKLRFECWTVEQAIRLGADPSSFEGYGAGFTGAPCPGPARGDAYRMGWEMGAIAAYRVPVPAWMHACNAQAAAGCIGSA
jgi:hypothetical protein